MQAIRLKRIDHLINRLIALRNEINDYYVIDYQIDKQLAVVEVAVEVVADEVDSETREYGN